MNFLFHFQYLFLNFFIKLQLIFIINYQFFKFDFFIKLIIIKALNYYNINFQLSYFNHLYFKFLSNYQGNFYYNSIIFNYFQFFKCIHFIFNLVL